MNAQSAVGSFTLLSPRENWNFKFDFVPLPKKLKRERARGPSAYEVGNKKDGKTTKLSFGTNKKIAFEHLYSFRHCYLFGSRKKTAWKGNPSNWSSVFSRGRRKRGERLAERSPPPPFSPDIADDVTLIGNQREKEEATCADEKKRFLKIRTMINLTILSN